jgi:DNA/RNA-binding domain of Phe-tRNA-synthetase-like protein
MFAYAPELVERYPTIRAGVVHATGLVNGPSPSGLLEDFRREQRTAVRRLEGLAIADLPSIAAWRRAFAAFGAKPTQYRSAAEALLRRLAKHGDSPSINILVDIGNLVSIRHAVPVAVFDLGGVDGSITVRFATGDERFTDLGTSESVSPDPGEVVFVDSRDVVCARRWCWRQSAQSATSDTTTEALIVVEGHHDSAARDVDATLADLTSFLGAYQPGSRVSARVLSAAHPSVRSGQDSGRG